MLGKRFCLTGLPKGGPPCQTNDPAPAGRPTPPAGSRMEPESHLTDEQWLLIADLFPEPERSPQGGRPPTASRACVEGILWVLRTGARWKDLPKYFPSPCTCWRRFRLWTETGAWQRAWARLARQLDRHGQVRHEETIADGTFSPAKKGGNASARPSAARAPRSWCSSMARDCPWLRRSIAPARTKST